MRHINWLKNINLAEATAIIFDRFEGNSINIDNDEDANTCKEAIRAFEFVQPKMLDFADMTRKYVINANSEKKWSRDQGIVVSDNKFNLTQVDHKYIVRHDSKTFMLDWWDTLLTIDPQEWHHNNSKKQVNI